MEIFAFVDVRLPPASPAVPTNNSSKQRLLADISEGDAEARGMITASPPAIDVLVQIRIWLTGPLPDSPNAVYRVDKSHPRKGRACSAELNASITAPNGRGKRDKAVEEHQRQHYAQLFARPLVDAQRHGHQVPVRGAPEHADGRNKRRRTGGRTPTTRLVARCSPCSCTK
jgi:hypothetical protein